MLVLALLVLLIKTVFGFLPDHAAKEQEGIYLLSELITDTILEPYSNRCTSNVINGGFITVANGSEILLPNATVNMPNLLIRCSTGPNITETEDLSLVLQNFVDSLDKLRVVDDTAQHLTRDSFEESILMITFASCSVCIGMWMVYLVIILLPAENHNGRRFSVQFYVLFSAIYEAVMLGKSVSKIFKKQYEGNFQDANAFGELILKSTSYRVGEIINNLLVFLNWDAIIFYMFHNYKRLHKNWLPSALSNRNSLIVYVGVGLTIIDTTLFAVMSWHLSSTPLRVCYKTVDYAIYTLFCGLTIYFISHDFWFVLAPKRIQSKGHIGIKSVLVLIWRDYHETIPLLLYNTTLFILLYFTSIYFTAQGTGIGQWHFKVVKFLRLIITVSVWGLIDVLERRELILSRETVLGRKIHNNDEYFFDPNLPYGIGQLQEDSRSRLSRSHSSDSSSHGDSDNTLGKNNWQNSMLKHPLKVWKSQVRRARSLKKYSGAKHRKLLETLAGKRDQRQRSEMYQGKLQVNESDVGDDIVPSNSAAPKVFKMGDIAIGDNDNASAETELARNYIYNYDNGSEI